MRETIGKLECLKRPGEDASKCCVLLHGFGADAADLYPLAEVLDPDGEWTFVVPNAPFEVPVGPAWMGRGWFPISVRALETGVDFTRVRPPGLDESAALVNDLLFELNPARLVLGGFSQGAMVATDVALGRPDGLAGLILYSGALLDLAGWSRRAPEAVAGLKVVQSHGTADPILPFSGGQALFDLLKGAGADIQFVSFPGGHEIPPAVLRKSSELLRVLR
jgi:phospholipase/carboxylesterase